MENEPNSEIFLLLEDYGKSLRARAAAASYADWGSDPRPIRLLLEDYPRKRQDWFDAHGEGATLPPSQAPPPALLVEDFDPVKRFWESPGEGVWPPDPATPINLEVDWPSKKFHNNWREARLGSLALHVIAVLVLLALPRSGSREPTEPTKRDYTQITLLAPPSEALVPLREGSPVEGDGDRGFQGLAGQPREAPPAPEIEAPPEPAPAPAAVTPQPVEVPEPEPTPQPPANEEPEPEEPDATPAAKSPAPGEFQRGRELARARDPRELPMPKAPPSKKPKLELEDPKAVMPGRRGGAQLGALELTARPDQIIQGAIENMQRGGGRQAVGDGVGAGDQGGYTPPSPKNSGSKLELLSDPKGVDFRPYLTQVLAAVRRNWFAVLPESARLGMSRGRVLIQFSVARNGSVPKLVIANPSGTQSLDRASVAGISASNPFPPLPAEFTGSDIRLQLTFLYNMK